jgi:hypothetical protein
MKRLFYLFLVFQLFLLSCQETPEAYFYTNTVTPDVGQEVFFTNDSRNAKRFEWDFGDGTVSDVENPVHIFRATGTYEVTLTAISKSGDASKSTLLLDVLIPTLLEIEVLEYYEEYPVADASVILYPSITDWDAQTNKLSEGFTDADGFVVFSGLDKYGYYVDVWEENHDNYLLRDEDYRLYIQTPDVIPHKINRFIAWVDYVDHTKGAAKGTRTIVIKKFEKARSVKRQAEAGSDTKGWQELYKRSIRIK